MTRTAPPRAGRLSPDPVPPTQGHGELEVQPRTRFEPFSTGRNSDGSGRLLYLYAVLEPAPALLSALRDGAISGIAGEPLHAVQAGGLLAAVSAVPEDAFCEEALNALLADLARLAPLTVRHQEAVHALWQRSESIVPITFGAVYRDRTGVERLLRDEAPRFRELLATLRGAEEWGVRVLLDGGRFDRTVAQRSPLLQQLAAEEAAAGPGRAYLLERRRERALVTERGRIAAQVVERITVALAPHVAQARSGTAGATEGEGQVLAANLAFLVSWPQRQAFLAAVDELAAQEQEAGVLLLRSGPWAPYSFVRTRPV